MPVLAHLSDPHLPMPRPRLSELAGKRTLGFLNWHRGRSREHRFEILDGAVDEAVGAIAAGHGWHERRRAGCEDQLVVGQHLAAGGTHRLADRVDRGGTRVQLEQQVLALEEARRDKRQVVRRSTRKELGQVHAVIGGARLLGQHCDVDGAHACLVQALQKLVTHHAVANDDDVHDE